LKAAELRDNGEVTCGEIAAAFVSQTYSQETYGEELSTGVLF